MARKTKKYKLVNSVDFKNQIITHLKRYNKFCFLDGNNSHDKYSSFDYLAAFDSKIEYKQTKNPFEGSFANKRKAASPMVEVNTATKLPKLILPCIYCVTIIIAPPHPGSDPRNEANKT